jgi:hypothetical protein
VICKTGEVRMVRGRSRLGSFMVADFGTEFHGMDPELMNKSLQVLVKRSKAQVFGSEDSLGVKFF